jgi:hypothetical protein
MTPVSCVVYTISSPRDRYIYMFVSKNITKSRSYFYRLRDETNLEKKKKFNIVLKRFECLHTFGGFGRNVLNQTFCWCLCLIYIIRLVCVMPATRSFISLPAATDVIEKNISFFLNYYYISRLYIEIRTTSLI